MPHMSHVESPCSDVQIEPTLLPITENKFKRGVSTADNAKLDIFARGLRNNFEKSFVDIRITHPTSQPYTDKSLCRFQQHESEKEKYNQRVIDI